ncbi:TOBE domain-containing protein [Halorussus vallis]|nr:TOBE domain-containing protein [Halorussus vallis]
MRLGAEAEGLDNAFEAEVVDEIYKGNLGKFEVTLENGQPLTVDMQITDRGEYLSTGRTVTVGWTADNAVVLTR